MASQPLQSTIADHFGTASLSNSRRHGQFFLDLHNGEDDDFALKGSCDQARFLGFLKKANGPVSIFFFLEGDGGPQSNLCKTPTAVLFAEDTFRGQS